MTAPTYTVEQLVRVEVRGVNGRIVESMIIAGLRIPLDEEHLCPGVVRLTYRAADAPAVLAWLDAQGVGRG